jgi:hypothetical protein
MSGDGNQRALIRSHALYDILNQLFHDSPPFGNFVVSEKQIHVIHPLSVFEA